MRLVTFEDGKGARIGALHDNGVIDLARADGSLARTMQEFIEAGSDALDRARRAIERNASDTLIPIAKVRLLAPLPRPIRLRDCSLFLEHMEVALGKMAEIYAAQEPDPKAALERLLAAGKYSLNPQYKQQIIYYNADHLHVLGPDDEIAWPSYSEWMDYELEWACVIGRTGRDIPRERAHEYIFGFTIFNDWSARDVQLPFMEANLGPGEGKDFANSIGPAIATFDELAAPYALPMTARVNGELWSRGSTASMHHRFEDAIVQFSRERTLYAGEVIGSGTVLSGCGFELGRRLEHGDVVELEIEGIGVLRNRVVRR